MVSIGELMGHPEQWAAQAAEALRSNPELLFLRKWGCWREEVLEDPRTGKILEQLYKVWPRLSADQRRLYLQAAEGIAQAENAKNAWTPKTSRPRYVRLAKTAVAAARLVQEIGSIFTPPWEGEEAKVGELVNGLATFVLASVSATFLFSRDEAVEAASNLLRTAKKRIPRRIGGMRWELLRDLVWLASRGKRHLDESTVRRYPPKQSDKWWNPVAAHLDFNLFSAAYDLAGQWHPEPEEQDKPRQSEAGDWTIPLDPPGWSSGGSTFPSYRVFNRVARRFLTTSSVPDTSPENPA